MMTTQEVKWLFVDYPVAERMFYDGEHPHGAKPRAFANWFVRTHLRPQGITVRTEPQPQRAARLLREMTLPDTVGNLSIGTGPVMAKYEPPRVYAPPPPPPPPRPGDIAREKPWVVRAWVDMGWQWQEQEWRRDYPAYLLANADMKPDGKPRGPRDGDVWVWTAHLKQP